MLPLYKQITVFSSTCLHEVARCLVTYITFGLSRLQIEYYFVNIAVTICNGNTKSLCSGTQFLKQVTFHRLVIVPVTFCRRNSYICQLLRFAIITNKTDAESSSTSCSVRYYSFIGVFTGLCHIHTIFYPFATSDPSDSISAIACHDVHTCISTTAIVRSTIILRVIIMVGDTLATLIEIFSLDSARQADFTLERCACNGL